jgi:hypothetical protein
MERLAGAFRFPPTRNGKALVDDHQLITAEEL